MLEINDDNSRGTAPQEGVPAANTSPETLMALVYDQLRALAGSYLKRERPDNMLEPSLLVHETYLRLAENPPDSWTSAGHFFAVAAAAMRRVLIDHARKRRALKRGFGQARVSLDLVTASGEREVEIQELDGVLNRLAVIDPRAAKVVDLKFFTGLTNEQIGLVLGVSRKTVVADWGRAREWLAEALADHPPPRRRIDPSSNGHLGGEHFVGRGAAAGVQVVTRPTRRRAGRAIVAE